MEPKKYNYPQKIWTAGGIIALLILILLFTRAIFNVLLLVLVSSLIAVFFRGVSDYLREKTKWKKSLTLVVSIAGTILIIGFISWLIGAKVQAQMADLMDDLTSSGENEEEKQTQSSE